MQLRKLWKSAVALLLVLLILQIGVALLVRTRRAREFLTRQLESSFGRPVDVRQFSATLFPTPQIDAAGISVGEDPAFGHEYFLRAERLSAGLRWIGLLRGRFELGTLKLDRPSLIFARNSAGRLNLERWLPAVPQGAGNAASQPLARTQVAYHLQKIEISDGRANFKEVDDKTSFAFLHVEGSIEQVAPGRWQLDLTAAPWRSGVSLQLAGVVRLRGDVAGTSARLQPAHFNLSWEKGSLADVFRLIGGRDFGVRGTFAAEAAAESGAVAASVLQDPQPGDWTFSVQVRASEIHRWDLTERADNPRISVRLNGRWNPAAGTVNAEKLLLESPRSNVRGVAFASTVVRSSLGVRLNSAAIQAEDFLDWYRAFRPNVSEEIRVKQFFTGSAVLSGWPLKVNEGSFSSLGGRWNIPGFASPLEIRAIQAARQQQKLTVSPFMVVVPPATAAPKGTLFLGSSLVPVISTGATATLSAAYDFVAHSGGIHIEGQGTRVQDILAIAASFGRPLQNGWELNGNAAGDLHWNFSRGTLPSWEGHADVSQATLQLAGLNQPVNLESVHAEWRNGLRKFTLAKVQAFGSNWSGSVEQQKIPPSDFGEPEIAAWNFQLLADHLDAAELDRWIGPRARPSWLQRLLPGFGGSGKSEPPSAVLRKISAAGDLRIDELTIEKMKFKQFRAQTKLNALNLSLRNIQAQWAGGQVTGSMSAALSAKPIYEVDAAFDRVAIAQTPWLASLSERLTGTAAGKLQIKAAGIGRDALLGSLSGKGELRLANVELRGWDLAGTMAQGEWKTGTSRWPAGSGTFHISDAGFDLNHLRLASSSGDFLLKGSVSFAQDADLTAESQVTGRGSRAENTVRFMQISGKLGEPKVSLERSAAQQPGD
jgi:uncharacterized protein involved in outer membrane biogenesis